MARNVEEAETKARIKLGSNNDEAIVVKQDEDVLDTWFSSGLLPLSAFGWPEKVNFAISYCTLRVSMLIALLNRAKISKNIIQCL